MVHLCVCVHVYVCSYILDLNFVDNGVDIFGKLIIGCPIIYNKKKIMCVWKKESYILNRIKIVRLHVKKV